METSMNPRTLRTLLLATLLLATLASVADTPASVPQPRPSLAPWPNAGAPAIGPRMLFGRVS
jgi:hypothetical protein